MTGEIVVARRRTPSCSPPAATATCSTCRPTRWPATSPRAWRAHRRGASFANPCYTQIHPTCIPQADDFQSKLTLMSESLRNDGRIWVPKNPDETRPRRPDPRGRTRLLPRAHLPELRQPRAARHRRRVPPSGMVDAGQGVGPLKNGVYLDFAEAIGRLGEARRRGALRQPVRHVRADHRREPVRRCRCASTPPRHYTMGGLWVDYELMTTIPGLYCAGEANFSDHGANRLGASALMQGLPTATSCCRTRSRNYLADWLNKPIPGADARGVRRRRAGGRRSVHGGTCRSAAPASPDHFHRELGKIIWDYCGMERTAQRAREGAVGDPRPATRSSRRT